MPADPQNTSTARVSVSVSDGLSAPLSYRYDDNTRDDYITFNLEPSDTDSDDERGEEEEDDEEYRASIFSRRSSFSRRGEGSVVGDYDEDRDDLDDGEEDNEMEYFDSEDEWDEDGEDFQGLTFRDMRRVQSYRRH